MGTTWRDEEKVKEYVGRVGRLAARQAGEAELVEALPADVSRVLDLGCGDGRLTLFAEIVGLLRPGGVFTNLEVVQCATPELHEELNRRIERPDGDPEDILAPVEPQRGCATPASRTSTATGAGAASPCWWVERRRTTPRRRVRSASRRRGAERAPSVDGPSAHQPVELDGLVEALQRLGTRGAELEVRGGAVTNGVIDEHLAR